MHESYILVLLETEDQYRCVFQPLFFYSLFAYTQSQGTNVSSSIEGQSPQFVPVQYVRFTLTVVYFLCINLCPDRTRCPGVRKSSGQDFVCLRVRLLPDSRYHPTLSFYQSPILCVCSPTELLRHHRPKASQTSRQASDALHAVQPEGKQEGKTPIHGVCFYCLSSHPLTNTQGF